MTTLLRPRMHRKPVRSELDGSLAGIEREHWDDHQDAVAFGRHPHVIVGDGLTMPGLWAPGVVFLVRRERRPWRGMRDLARSLYQNEVGAFGNGGLFGSNLDAVLDATQLAIDLSLTTHKIAMYTDTLTPDYNAATPGYSATNEVTGTGYTAGGQVIVSPTSAAASGIFTYDLGDQIWASPTTVTARGAIEYADALVGNNLIVASGFGADITSTAGTFTIAWNVLGVFTIDYIP